MKPRVRMLAYNPRSASARALARELNVLRINSTMDVEGHLPDGRPYGKLRTKFAPRSGDLIINWGHSARGGLPGKFWMGSVHWLNFPTHVATARDKLATFEVLQKAGVPTVEWTTNDNEACSWVKEGDPDDIAGFARKSLSGQGGSGIVPFYHGTEYSIEGDIFPDAPLYTRMFNARHECRVHVFRGDTFAQKKRRRNGAARSPIRNYANGYVYCTGNFDCPRAVLDVGRLAVTALGLQFGAVDILYTEGAKDIRVLEVNTAPGVEGSTLNWYAGNFSKEINNVR